MNYSSGLEYIVGSFYSNGSYNTINYFSKNLKNQRFLMMIENRFAIYRHIDDKDACENASHARVQLYEFEKGTAIILESQYMRKAHSIQYNQHQQYSQPIYLTHHSFTPEVFLKPSRPKARFIDDNSEAKAIAEEIFELMKQKLPSSISINILPFDEFRALHSSFGSWSNGILGFSVNGSDKKIFVRENYLDSLMLVIGHEIGHVLTDTLPNKHDEEAKAFAFSIEWARTIKEHNIANLGSSIKDDVDFQPARNGLHDVAFAFVDFMVKKGRKAIELHRDLAKHYISMFNSIYYPK